MMYVQWRIFVWNVGWRIMVADAFIFIFFFSSDSRFDRKMICGSLGTLAT